MKNPEVDKWFENYSNPMKPVVQAVRGVIMENPKMEETIKWQAPTFMYKRKPSFIFP